jgi:cytochrome c-type biogenesis protein CcmE
VKEDSVVKNGRDIAFTVTDRTRDLPIAYTGVVLDLFREGQGVVVDGQLQPDGKFRADSVLAKHDERYMPRDVADALKKQGVWQGEKK